MRLGVRAEAAVAGVAVRVRVAGAGQMVMTMALAAAGERFGRGDGAIRGQDRDGGEVVGAVAVRVGRLGALGVRIGIAGGEAVAPTRVGILGERVRTNIPPIGGAGADRRRAAGGGPRAVGEVGRRAEGVGVAVVAVLVAGFVEGRGDARRFVAGVDDVAAIADIGGVVMAVAVT